MDNDSALVIVTGILAIVTAMNLYVAFYTRRTLINLNKNTALIYQTQRNEQNLSTNPELLALYNLDLEDLEKAGITSQELLFILSDLRQGEIFHRIENYKSKDDMLSEYRKNFLSNEKVQIAFIQFIYGRLMSKSEYLDILNKYIDHNILEKEK
jgi:hypothetical protein